MNKSTAVIILLLILLFIYWFPTVDLNGLHLGALQQMFEQMQMTTTEIRDALNLPTQQLREWLHVWLRLDQP